MSKGLGKAVSNEESGTEVHLQEPVGTGSPKWVSESRKEAVIGDRFCESCRHDTQDTPWRIKRPEIGELFRLSYRSVRQERRRLRDRLSDHRDAQDLFKELLGKWYD